MDTIRPVINVAFVQSHSMVVEGLIALATLRPAFSVTLVVPGAGPLDGEFTSGAPNVAVLGAEHDEFHGLELVSRVRSAVPGVCIVLIVTRPRDAVFTRAIDDGVEGIVCVSDSFATLVTAIEAVHASRRYFAPSVYRSRGVKFASLADAPAARLRAPKLTARQFEVLTHLVGGRSVRETAERMQLTANTVDNHKSRIMRKFGVHNSVELTRYVIREGLIDP